MGFNVELRGHGVRALHAFIAQQVSTKDGLGELGEDGALTTAQLRHAAVLLRDLRSNDCETPTIASFFKQRGGVRLHAASDQDGELVGAVPKGQAAYMEKRRRRLLRLDEEMRYGKLVHNVKKKTSAVELEQYQKSVRQHLSIGANMIAARITAFVAMYMLARTLSDNETTRIIVGLGGAIGMMVIEMILYIARSSKYEAIEREQQRQRPSVF